MAPSTAGIGIFIVLVGLCGAAVGATSLIRSLRARRWPFVIGRVIDTKVLVPEGRKENTFTHVLYRYDVGGITYRSDRRDFGWSLGPQSIMQPDVGHERPDLREELQRDFPEGGGVRVYVNPRKPSASVLETRLVPMAFFFLGFGLVFIGLGAVLFLGV